MSVKETGRVVDIGEPASRAVNLARNRTFGPGRALQLIPRLDEAGSVVRQLCARKTDAVTPERQWLTGNYRFLETQVRQVRKLLPQIQREELPLVTNGPLFGFPRIFELAVEMVDAADARVTEESTAAFIREYQSVAPLTMAELWIVDTMLRLALIEDLSRNPHRAPDSITSLNAVSSAAWKDFVEENSRTEQILREDPAGAYPNMDFDTRDRYRHAVEDIARRSQASEEDVARAAVTLARDAAKRLGPEARESHVGYHLIDSGAPRLKDGLQYRPPLRGRITRAILKWPTAFYLFGIELITLALAVYLLAWLPDDLHYLGLILFFLATEPAIVFMNQLAVYLVRPCRLPKLDFSEGIPPEYRTLVVVPTLLLSEDFIGKLLNDLEVRFLANKDPQLTFALLTDFADSSEPVARDDERLEEFCVAGIRKLNERYASEGREPFYLFHRRREWNEKQSAWMGWERKRGKLIALNDLLRGAGDAFAIKIGDLSMLPSVRYVITLDSDTELPRGAAQQLAGTLAHPLNRAVIDPATNTVHTGYGILQPRVGISVHSSRRSRLASIYSGQTGVDIYTTAVSDVYQDLFGEGSYVGKGIYDVDVFQATLSKRFPHDVLLSHDLIEGTHARAGLVSDIEMIDDYPSHYSAWSKRKHRWVRGDWQIMHWLFPRVRDYYGRQVHNPLSVISLWKIVDNLRRSLIEIAMFVLLVAGWTFMPGGALYWTAVVTGISLLPVYLQALFGLLRTPVRGRWWVHLREVASGFWAGHVDVALRLIFLAHQTCLMLDAILRSIFRATVTGRRLLEWESAAQAEMGAARNTFRSIDSYLWLATPLSLAAAALIFRVRPEALRVAAPFLAAWFFSPLAAVWLNSSLPTRKERVREEDRPFLRGVALRTWRFFADFADHDGCRLIPDNVREEGAVAAQRVSPTNIGLLLNAQLAARDFGYIGRADFLENTAAILASMDRMERYRGHFFNWYDSRTLAALSPRYVSTVDSGNLAACLIALRQGLLEERNMPAVSAAIVDALRDHARVAREDGEPCAALEQSLAAAPPRHAGIDEWRSWLERVADSAGQSRDALRTIQSHLRDLAERPSAEEIDRLAGKLSELIGEMDFSFLLDPKRKLFSIGYNAESAAFDTFEYGLLASEARIASFVAIAKNDIPKENWLRLGRTLTRAARENVLLSWTGTMFEYLMPFLWMNNYPETLLDQSARGAVKCQRGYAASRRVPWGISESACAEREESAEYRYYAFGVPDLRLKPDEDKHLVIAPYASMLALMIAPKQAADNLRRQAGRGWLARYGFYEAADFTGSPARETLVRGFMAHHQGMSLLALDNALHRNAMQKRFHREPMVQATELLLQERLPVSTPIEKAPAAFAPVPHTATSSQNAA